MQFDKTVYIETSVVAHLTGKPSEDLSVAARRVTTAHWWDIQRPYFVLFTSILAIEAAEREHLWVDKRHLDALDATTRLPVTDVADALIRRGAVPEKARNAAMETAVAAVNQIAYLLTWNFQNLNNSIVAPLIRQTCEEEGYRCPVICCPDALWVVPPEEDVIMKELREQRKARRVTVGRQ